MKIESKFVKRGTWIVKKELEESYDQKSLLVEEHVTLTGEKSELIRSYQLCTSGFMLLNTQMYFSAPETDLFEIDGECIVMNFMYGSNVVIQSGEPSPAKVMQANTHNIWYRPNYRATYKMLPFQQINYLCIILSKEFYLHITGANPDIHPDFSKNISKGKASFLSPSYLPLSLAMQWVIQEINNCQRQGLIKRMYIETKVKELLLLQLEMLNATPSDNEIVFEDADLNKLQEAKKILDLEYRDAPTIAELSKRVALNEFKLKKGFKACFDSTIKSYVIKLKMELAKKLFQSKVESVASVAYQCGYKDVSHFSAAFKSFYGFSPQKFKISFNTINVWLTGLLLASI